MKLRYLIIRLIVVWIPVLPPTPLIARQQREISPRRAPARAAVSSVDSVDGWPQLQQCARLRGVAGPSVLP